MLTLVKTNLVVIHEYPESNMNKNQLKGRLELVAGNAKEAVGKVLDDENMEMEGKVRKNVGKVRVRFADLKEEIKNAELILPSHVVGP